ncbi:hypothetical protein LXL04_021635 [Taraxacum kok-saghyz]
MPVNGDQGKRPKREYTDATHRDQSGDQSFNQRRALRSGYVSLQSYIRDRTDELVQIIVLIPHRSDDCAWISHRHIDLFLDFLITVTGVLLSFDRIQLQHKFWQPNVQHDSITAQFNYNSIQLQQNSITFLSITTNQTGPKLYHFSRHDLNLQSSRPINIVYKP